ncbi:MAG: DUF2726 domain-containing protein [Bacilli bacterium]|nr:DUF2726 domain-containing protein [Bacilli bacterium]
MFFFLINCKILLGIELDDKSHYNKTSIKNDKFKSKLFKELSLNLFRYKVSYKYDFSNLNSYLYELENSVIAKEQMVSVES